MHRRMKKRRCWGGRSPRMTLFFEVVIHHEVPWPTSRKCMVRLLPSPIGLAGVLAMSPPSVSAWFEYAQFAFLLDVNEALRQGKVQSIHSGNVLSGSSQALSHACGAAGFRQVKKNMAAGYRTLVDILARAPKEFPEIQVDISNELVIGVLLNLPWDKEEASALWNRVVEEARAGQRLADAYQQPNKLNREIGRAHV